MSAPWPPGGVIITSRVGGEVGVGIDPAAKSTLP